MRFCVEFPAPPSPPELFLQYFANHMWAETEVHGGCCWSLHPKVLENLGWKQALLEGGQNLTIIWGNRSMSTWRKSLAAVWKWYKILIGLWNIPVLCGKNPGQPNELAAGYTAHIWTLGTWPAPGKCVLVPPLIPGKTPAPPYHKDCRDLPETTLLIQIPILIEVVQLWKEESQQLSPSSNSAKHHTHGQGWTMSFCWVSGLVHGHT